MIPERSVDRLTTFHGVPREYDVWHFTLVGASRLDKLLWQWEAMVLDIVGEAFRPNPRAIRQASMTHLFVWNAALESTTRKATPCDELPSTTKVGENTWIRYADAQLANDGNGIPGRRHPVG